MSAPPHADETPVGSKRTLILVAAVLIGAIAAYALYTYVNGIEERAYQNAEKVRVFVVAQDIPAGTPGDQVLANRLIRQGEIPREFLPSTALTDSSVISGKVARTDLAAGQVVVVGMFVDQAEVVASWSDRLEVGEVAVTISLDQVRAVGGLIQPGDRVSMLVETTASVGESTEPADKTIRHLYQNVDILAIGNVGVGQTPDSGQAASSGLITLAVPPDAAQRIVYARDSIYLLLEPKNFLATDLPPITDRNLFDKPLTPAPDAG